MEFKKVLLFPRMVFEILLQIVYFTLTEAETFLMVASSLILGILLGWLWGLAIFLGTYTISHLIGGYVSLLAASIRQSKR